MTQVKNLPPTKSETKAKRIEQTTGQPSANVTEQVKVEPKPEQPTEETTESRLARVYDLFDTAQKLEAYQRSRAELKSFKIGSNSMRSTLVIMDDQGKRFETSNSTAIALLVESLLGILDGKIAETEKQIRF